MPCFPPFPHLIGIPTMLQEYRGAEVVARADGPLMSFTELMVSGG